MSNYAITAANVRMSNNGTPEFGVAGVALTQGQAVYLDTADGKLKLFDANGTGDAKVFRGITLNAAAADQPIKICREDPDFTPGCTMAVGDTVIGSATAGAICPDSDAAGGWFKTVLGTAKTTTTMIFKPLASGAAIGS
jgi:hypothetical protein